jgi:2-polyprenyl-3-methyl-5-hydroxy-6-metoxy-1,4-benzoquinol methylase
LRRAAPGLSAARSSANHFDGIFANASLFHVPTWNCRACLASYAQALKPRGVLFASNPHGNDDEG